MAEPAGLAWIACAILPTMIATPDAYASTHGIQLANGSMGLLTLLDFGQHEGPR